MLDLFAGSGALGLEALSRGASHVCFVESNRSVLQVLRRNIEVLDVASRSEVRTADALTVVSGLARSCSRPWDLVLADPPYAGEAADRLVSTFSDRPFASILCVEHASRVDFSIEPDWQRRYGETTLSFFMHPVEGAAHG